MFLINLGISKIGTKECSTRLQLGKVSSKEPSVPTEDPATSEQASRNARGIHSCHPVQTLFCSGIPQHQTSFSEFSNWLVFSLAFAVEFYFFDSLASQLCSCHGPKPPTPRSHTKLWFNKVTLTFFIQIKHTAFKTKPYRFI